MIAVLDTSGWHRLRIPSVAAAWRAIAAAGEAATCGGIRYELLYSARSANDYEHWAAVLDELVQVPTDASCWDRALEVQRTLAHQGGMHHRSVKLVDLLVAAAAEQAGAMVLHYDEDYDRIASITGQQTSWIAPRGTV